MEMLQSKYTSNNSELLQQDSVPQNTQGLLKELNKELKVLTWLPQMHNGLGGGRFEGKVRPLCIRTHPQNNKDPLPTSHSQTLFWS